MTTDNAFANGEQTTTDGMQTAHVKLNGATATLTLDKLPAMGDSMRFVIDATLTGQGVELRADNELRRVLTMRVEAIEGGDITPHVGEPQLPYGDDDALGDEDELDDEKEPGDDPADEPLGSDAATSDPAVDEPARDEHGWPASDVTGEGVEHTRDASLDAAGRIVTFTDTVSGRRASRAAQREQSGTAAAKLQAAEDPPDEDDDTPNA